MSELERLLRELRSLADTPFEKVRAMPPGMYLSEQVHALEVERIFRVDWLCVGRADELPEPGDYLTYEIADQPIALIRQRDSSIRAFANVCKHRMAQLLDGDGHCARIACPYHAWSYGIDGRLFNAPHMQEHPDFDAKSIRLDDIACEVWHGWVFVSLSAEPTPLRERLAPMDDLMTMYGVADYRHLIREDHVWQTNWKVLAENFMEGYHLPVVHRASVGTWMIGEETEFVSSPTDSFTYQTFPKIGESQYGVAHPKNERLQGKWRQMSLMPTVFPSFMTVLGPDLFWYLSLRPQGAAEVRVRFGVALAPEVADDVEDLDAKAAEMTELFAKVNAEDRSAAERVYRGMRGRLSTPGPLNWVERELHDLMRYLAIRLCEDAGS